MQSSRRRRWDLTAVVIPSNHAQQSVLRHGGVARAAVASRPRETRDTVESPEFADTPTCNRSTTNVQDAFDTSRSRIQHIITCLANVGSALPDLGNREHERANVRET